MKPTRPSSMPRAFDCPGSLEPARAPINHPSDESDLGTAAHVALKQLVQGVETELAEVARLHGVAVDELGPLVAFGRKAWRDLGPLFPGVETEVPLESDITTGTADLLSATPAALVVGDWKSGRVRRSYRRQLQAYAYAARAKYGMPASGVITAVVVWLRFAEFEVMHFSAEDLDAFRADYLALEHDVGRHFAPGEHCDFCPRRAECGARDAFMRSSVTALVAANQDGLTPARMAEMYPRVQQLEKAIEAYKTAVRLALAGGALPVDETRQLELVEARRSVLDARAAWPVLAAHGFSEDDIARTLSMSKTEVEAVAGEKAPRGLKGRRQAELVRALEDGGALQHTTFTKLQLTKRG